MTFKNALKQIQAQNIEVWTAADEVRMALQLMKADATQRQAAAIEKFNSLFGFATHLFDICIEDDPAYTPGKHMIVVKIRE